jgi:hypothetical protein
MDQEAVVKDRRLETKKKTMNAKILITGIVVYIVSAVVSFLIFSGLSGPSAVPVAAPKKTASGGLMFDDSLPKTESCPINGAKYSKQQRAWWEKHEPLGVMIENHTEARPQSGISFADVVYEAIAEGGITRFLTVFYCQDADVVGPVRSARTYFIDFLSEYGSFPLYAHVGGANSDGQADALGQLETYGWAGVNDLNQFSIGFPVFLRDYDRLGRTVATEHTMYSSTTKLWDYAAKSRKITNVNPDGEKWDKDFVPYTFKEDAALSTRPAAQTVSYDFWDGYGDFSVLWNYDKTTNSYLRTNGGKPHLDLDTKKQLTAKNVIVLFMKESRANDGYEGNLHMLYGTKGTGNAKVFMDGVETDAIWSKKSRTAHLYLKDKRGQDIELNRGKSWFSIVSPTTDVTVK